MQLWKKVILTQSFYLLVTKLAVVGPHCAAVLCIMCGTMSDIGKFVQRVQVLNIYVRHEKKIVEKNEHCAAGPVSPTLYLVHRWEVGLA